MLPNGQQLPELNITNLKNIVSADYGEYKFIVDKLIPRQGITIISGKPKSGKSWFVMKILIDIAKQQKVFGKFDVQPTKILLIDEENSKRGLQRRFKKLSSELIDVPVASLSGFKIDQKLQKEQLKKYLLENKIDMVIFDSFRRIHSLDENVSKDISKIYDYLKEVMVETGVAILLIHHNRKVSKGETVDMESLRGSGDIGAMVDSFILLNSIPLRDINGNSTVVTTVLREDIPQKDFQIYWYDDENNNIIFEYKGIVEENYKKVERGKEIIYNFIKNSNGSDVTFNILKNSLSNDNIGEKNMREALKNLEAENKIDFYKGGKTKREKFYILSTKNEPKQEDVEDYNLF